MPMIPTSEPGVFEAAAAYPCLPETPRRARAWSVDNLGPHVPERCSPVLGDAALVVSELVTNAIQAQCHEITLKVEVDDDHLRIGVTDDAEGQPEVRRSPPTATGGRGLFLVEAVSDEWGCDRHGAGKEVWASFSLPPD